MVTTSYNYLRKTSETSLGRDRMGRGNHGRIGTGRCFAFKRHTTHASPWKLSCSSNTSHYNGFDIEKRLMADFFIVLFVPLVSSAYSYYKRSFARRLTKITAILTLRLLPRYNFTIVSWSFVKVINIFFA